MILLGIRGPVRCECQFCHTMQACIPFGPGRKMICHDCAAKDDMIGIVQENFALVALEAVEKAVKGEQSKWN